METPFFLPQPTRIKSSSRSVSNRRTFQCGEPGDGQQRQNPGAPQTNQNRLKRTKTHKGLEHFTDYGNSRTLMTETSESNASCDVILINCKEKLLADAAITDGKDHSVYLPIAPDLLTESIRKEGHLSQTVQKNSQMQNEVSTKGSLKRNKLTLKRMSSNMGVRFVSIPAGSNDRSLKPLTIEHFAADKEVLSSCLPVRVDRLMDQPEVNIGQIPESTKHHESGQTLTPITPRTQHICREPTNVRILREMVSLLHGLLKAVSLT